MITEDGLADLFEQAVHDLDPAIHAILIRAEQRGRRLRSRRRIWLVLGSGLAVVALAGTALAAGGSLARPQGAQLAAGATHRHPTTKHAGPGHARPRPSGLRRPHAPSRGTHSAGSFPTVAPGYQMTVRQMLDVLRRLLPAGSTLSNVNNPYYTADGTLEVDYNDGQGAVDLIIDVSPTATYPSDAPLNCPKPLWKDEGSRPAGALPISCVMRTLPDGSIERDAVMYADAYGFYGYNIYDERPDGITVLLQVGNGINHTVPQVDRARPPGLMAEWEALVENPAWHLKKGWHLVN
jgi:hypothetical protein